ncbi:hypothetical protein [Gordonia sp. N1V]|uniref:hypothetical protein n=1 Tax=Gordonia sp. N1V TaxID=3034163 RepID=UPI0023E27381|nr:hypothetical protein [Gordonia sp. N1V]MDF3284966.1 hypothetical protein [Gordonia sp. N1V]
MSYEHLLNGVSSLPQQINSLMDWRNTSDWYSAVRDICRRIETNYDLSSLPERSDMVRLMRTFMPVEIWSAIYPQLSERFDDAYAEIDVVLGRELLSDAHLHSGGATPLSATIDLYIDNKRYSASEPVPQKGQDQPVVWYGSRAHGRSRHLDRVLNSLALASAVIECALVVKDDDILAIRGGSGTALSNILAGSYWTWLYDFMLDKSDSVANVTFESDLDSGYSMLSISGYNGGFPAIVRGVEAVRDRSTDLEAWFVELVRGCVASLGLISSALTSPMNDNLEEFGERFKLQSQLRKLHTQPGSERRKLTEADRVKRTLDALCGGSVGLGKIELRKTIDWEAPSIIDDIRSDIDCHLTGYVEFSVERAERIPELKVPMSLVRIDPYIDSIDATSNGLSAYRYPLLNSLRAVRGLAEFILSHPEFEPIVSSIDVAGNEKFGSNWIYLIAFQYFDAILDRAGIERSQKKCVHAGEFFYGKLEGLRRVGECLIVPGVVGRVGHALALCAERANRVEHVGPISSVSALKDLLWALTLVTDSSVSFDAGVIESLRGEIRRLGEVVFGHRFAPDVLVGWYRSMFSIEALVSAGVSSLTETSISDFTPIASPGEEAGVAAEFSDQISGLLCTSLFHGSRSIRLDDGRLVTTQFDDSATTDGAAYSHLCDQLYSGLRAAVLQQFRDHEVAIESCPTSNICLGGYSDYTSHPLRSFLDEDVLVTLNSDDPGLFGSNIADEYLSMWRTEQYQMDELRSVAARTKDLVGSNGITGAEHARHMLRYLNSA